MFNIVAVAVLYGNILKLSDQKRYIICSLSGAMPFE
jgi:hypothetical protein